MRRWDVYNDDVCNSKAKVVGSSFNSPKPEKQDEVQAGLEGEVDEVPGGNVSARSRSFGIRQSNAWTTLFSKTYDEYFVARKWHTKMHTCFRQAGKPNQTCYKLAAASTWDAAIFDHLKLGCEGD